MSVRHPRALRNTGRMLLLAAVVSTSVNAAQAYQLVPGTGYRITAVGDDFEDEKWSYEPNEPKASTNIDHQDRQPGGISGNSRIYESTYRGQPDVVRRVPTPPGGLPRSKGALLMQTRASGIPGNPTYKMQQDDLMVNVTSLLGGNISVSRSPSVVVRVYLPPWEQWEPRTGSSFALRADVEAWNNGSSGGFRRRMMPKRENYWPGIFIQFNRKADGHPKDNATLLIRGDQMGHEFIGPTINEPGWWTLGMSFTPDGMVHYYAHAGVERLTANDHITSQYPYGFHCDTFNTFFFNVVNQDNGRNVSTPWIVDNVALYTLSNSNP